METLIFTPDDSRLGKYTPDGGFESWPSVDVFGKPYQRQNATIKRVSPTQFVVVGPDDEKNIEGFSFERSSVVSKAAKSNE